MLRFKYELGDVLIHKGSLLEPLPGDPLRLVVVERTATEVAQAGTTLHYGVSVVGPSGEAYRARLGEEVVPYGEWQAADLARRKNQAVKTGQEAWHTLRSAVTGRAERSEQ